jgi:hypothetical protein
MTVLKPVGKLGPISYPVSLTQRKPLLSNIAAGEAYLVGHAGFRNDHNITPSILASRSTIPDNTLIKDKKAPP